MTKTIFLLLLIGGIFAIEALSVIIQVFSFKYFKRRVFLMAPIHHHFEMKAWSETKIMVRFWIVTGILCAVGFAPVLPLLPRVPLSELPQRVLVLGLARSGQGGGRGARAARGGGGRAPTASSGTTTTSRCSTAPSCSSRARACRARRRSSSRPSGAACRSGARSSSATGCSAARSSASPARTARRRPPSCSARSSTRRRAGNVGRALTELDGEVEPGALVVCELSSFQLEDVHELACEVAVLLNLEPDHLDRHGSFEAYRDAKLRIFERARAKVVPRGAASAGSSSRRTTSCRPSR